MHTRLVRLVFALQCMNIMTAHMLRGARAAISLDRMKHRIQKRSSVKLDMDKLSEEEFRLNFRLERSVFESLLTELSPWLLKDSQLAADRSVTPRVALAVTLFYFGGGKSMRSAKAALIVGKEELLRTQAIRLASIEAPPQNVCIPSWTPFSAATKICL